MTARSKKKNRSQPRPADIGWLDLDAARALIAQEIDDHLRAVIAAPEEDHPALVLRVSPGVGKTHQLMAALKLWGPDLLDRGHVCVYMPTHRLAEEAQAAFAGSTPELPSMVLRGRSARAPEGGRMCVRWELAEGLRGLVPSVKTALCERPAADGGVERAPCRDKCAYFAQLPQQNSVIFLAHAYLGTGSPVAGHVALRVIDEKFWSETIAIKHIAADLWLNGKAPDGMDKARAREAHAAVLSAVMAGASPIDALKRLPITQEAVRRLAAAQTKGLLKPDCSPTMTDEALDMAIARTSRWAIANARIRKGIWMQLADRWAHNSTERLTYGDDPSKREGPGLTIHGAKRIDDDVPTILLDADADPLIVAALMPDARFVDVRVRPNAVVVQVADRTLSTTSLTSGEKAEDMRRGVAAVVKREVEASEGPVMLVAARAVLRRLHEDANPAGNFSGDDALMAPLHGADARWLGPGMQGVNQFREHQTVVIVGRLEPGVEEIERQMRALFGDSDAPLRFIRGGNGMFETQDGDRLMANGMLVPATVRQHPDPRGAALLCQAREAASLQAIARIRAVSATKPKRIVVLSSVPLPDLPVSRLTTWRAIVADADPETLTPAYQRMRMALRWPKDGRLIDGLRLSPAGLREDAPWAFNGLTAAANWHASLTSDGIRSLAARVLENEGAAPAFVMLRRAGGGKATPAVVVRPGANPVATAETIWRGMTAEI